MHINYKAIVGEELQVIYAIAQGNQSIRSIDHNRWHKATLVVEVEQN